MKVHCTNGIGDSWKEDTTSYRFFCTGCQPQRFAEPKKAVGWICPACGCGNAPWNGRCDCHGIARDDYGSSTTDGKPYSTYITNTC